MNYYKVDFIYIENTPCDTDAEKHELGLEFHRIPTYVIPSSIKQVVNKVNKLNYKYYTLSSVELQFKDNEVLS